MKITSALGAIGVAALLAAIPAQAVLAQVKTVRVRGTVVSLEGPALTVKTREGDTVAVTLKPGWKVTGVARAAVEAIKPGDFVGVASLPTAAGGDGAVEVLVFPAAMKGTGEGSYPWDLQPGSTMTNATVANAVADVHGRTLTLTYQGGQKTVTIAQGTPVVTFAPATPDDLKPGATVFVPAEAGAGSALSAGFVVVGTHGVAPPM
ncbi:hypothetical protein [Labrys monachus]|uniref:DUF5666 domain-containing protein n=1 Tax=Labrys monachus TaxID=217067 RepID=A0ABU0FLM0_9HYPH|nr:hypothetical protein [Labrys monachus]MDQ0395501.1 hypothetical protein [Labrys monachus]